MQKNKMQKKRNFQVRNIVEIVFFKKNLVILHNMYSQGYVVRPPSYDNTNNIIMLLL